MKQERVRVLYVEKPVKVGGSVISLFELVRRLDTRVYVPVVLFYGPNPYRERFRALGIEVLVLNDVTPASASLATARRDIAASLSPYGRWLAEGYRTAKDVYRLAQRDWPQAQRLAQLIRDEAIDLVHHNNGVSGNRDTVLAARLAGVPQVCHVRTLHSLSFIERHLARFIDAFIYISKAVERVYRDMGIPDKKGRVVYNPIDVEEFGRADGAAELRAEFGFADRDRVISNVGRLDWWKGHDVFLQGMAQVVESEPGVKALIVGEADSTPLNRTYTQRLRQLVEDLRLSEQVIFAGYRSDIPRIMAASDVVVHSASEPEPFGRVIVEAMAASRPVVATAAGGVFDIVEDGITGLLVAPGNAGAMASAILQLLRNREQASTMGRRARERAKACFSAEQHVSAVQSVYQSLLST